MSKLNGWWIAVSGILLQMALGAVYAWSMFRVPLAKVGHWTISQVPSLHTVSIVTLVSFIILICYGGGFGTMPAFAADYFGPANIDSIYGLILTAWGFASGFGPLLIAHMRQSAGSYTSGLHVIAGIMALSTILALLVKPPMEARQEDLANRKVHSAERA